MGLYTEKIQQLYVAYFNRPADASGLMYWEAIVAASHGDTTMISANFAASNEYKAAYGGKSAYDVINTVYLNLFGRVAEPAGVTYWGQLLMNGALTIDQIVTKVAAGAQGTDKVAYNAKVQAAVTFTNSLDTTAKILAYDGDAANLVAKAYIASVTDAGSLSDAIAHLDQTMDRVIIAHDPNTPASAAAAAAAVSAHAGATGAVDAAAAAAAGAAAAIAAADTQAGAQAAINASAAETAAAAAATAAAAADAAAANAYAAAAAKTQSATDDAAAAAAKAAAAAAVSAAAAASAHASADAAAAAALPAKIADAAAVLAANAAGAAATTAHAGALGAVDAASTAAANTAAAIAAANSAETAQAAIAASAAETAAASAAASAAAADAAAADAYAAAAAKTQTTVDDGQAAAAKAAAAAAVTAAAAATAKAAGDAAAAAALPAKVADAAAVVAANAAGAAATAAHTSAMTDAANASLAASATAAALASANSLETAQAAVALAAAEAAAAAAAAASAAADVAAADAFAVAAGKTQTVADDALAAAAKAAAAAAVSTAATATGKANADAAAAAAAATQFAPKTYSLAADVSAVDEGGQITFRLNTTNVAPGTVLSYNITGIDASRINGSTAGQVTVDANGHALIVVKTIANAHTDGAGSIQLSLANGAASSSVTVNDTSLTPTTFTVDAAKIVAANNSASNPVVVTVADTGSATVNINSTSAVHSKFGIVIQGDADTTINLGTNTDGDLKEKIYLSGGGNTTVNIAHQTSDSVSLDRGNDTVVVTGLNMVAGQSIDGGDGNDTLDVHGDNDFSLGSISNIENVTMHSSAKFTTDQLASFKSVTEQAGGTGKLQVVLGATAIVDLSGKLSGLKELVLDTGVKATLTAADLAGVTTVTTTGTAVITTTVAGAQALLALNANVRYTIADTAVNLATAPAAVFQGAGLQQVSQSGAGALTIDQAVTVHAASPAANYTVAATAEQLIKALVFDATYDVLTSPRATIQVTGLVTVDNALYLSNTIPGGMNTSYTITDTAQHLADWSWALDVGEVDAIHLSGSVNASDAATIRTFAVNAGAAVTGLAVADSANHLLGMGAALVTMASSIALDPADRSVSVADAVALKAALGVKFSGGYDLEDSAANIVAKPAIAAGATNIVIDGTVGVAIASQLTGFGNAGTTSYHLSDSAANLAGASATVLSHASHVDVTGNVTVAQANALVGYAVDSFSLHDSVANILSASAAVIAKALAAGPLVTTDTAISAANAAALYALDANAVYSLTDNAANLVLALDNFDAVDQAVAIKVTGSATIEQAVAIRDALGVHVSAFAVADTVTAILDFGSIGVNLIGASTVSASGTASIAQVAQLQAITAFDHKFAISDSAHNVAVLVASGAAGIAELNASTAAVQMSGSINVADATVLKGAATFTNWNHQYDLVDNFTNLNAASAAVRTGAHTVYVEDSIVNVNTNFAWIRANTTGYIVDDLVANLVAGGNAIVVSGAVSGHATDVANAAQAAQLHTLNAGIGYDVADTAAALVLLANKAGVQSAGTVTLLGNASVAQAQVIASLHGGVAYDLNDSAANLAAAGAAVTVAGAGTVIVNTSASVAQASTIVGLNVHASLSTIVDTVAHIQAAASGVIDSALNLVVTDGNRINVTAAELAYFTQTGGVLNHVTTSAAGRSSNDVHFDVVDTMDHLANVGPDLLDAGRVTITAGGNAVDVNEAAFVLSFLPANRTIGAYAITGTVFDLLNPVNADAVLGAHSVAVTDNANAADAQALYALNPAATYQVVDSIANLMQAANSAAVHHADSVVVTAGTASVAGISALLALNASADYSSVVISDSAAKLAAAPAGVLNGHVVNVTGAPATIAQMHAIDVAAGHHVAMDILDTAAHVAAAVAAELALANSVTLTSAATALEGVKLSNLGVAYDVADTVAGILANRAGLGNAGNVTATDAATAAQAVELNNLGVTYSVADSAANLLNIDYFWVMQGAQSVKVLGTVDVATAQMLSWEANGTTLSYDVVDTMEHLVASTSQLSGGDAGNDLNNLLGHAHSVKIDGGATLTMTQGVSGQYYVAGTVAGLKAIPAGFLAHGYVLTDSVANIAANYAFAVGSNDGFNISDTGAHILSAAGSLVGTAHTVNVTDVIDATSATAILGANAASSFKVSDTVAKLIANGGATGHASAVTATDVANAANALALYNLNHGAKYAVSDSAVNLLGNTGYTHATSVSVTGATTTIAQIDAIKAGNTHVASYNLSDTAGNLVAAAAGDLSGATAVTVTGGADGLQAKAIYAANAAAKFSIVDSNAAHLFTGDTLNASAAAATSITGALTVDVAQAQALNALGAKFAGSFALNDTAAHIAAAGQALLTLATGVNLTGPASAADATVLAGLHYGAGAGTPIGYTIVDTTAHLLSASNAAGVAGHNVEVTDAVSVQQASDIDAANGASPIVIDHLSDSSTNLQLGATGLVDTAIAINVTDTQSMAQAQFMEDNVGSGTATYTFSKISDSVANVLSDLNLASEASVITMTGKATVAQAEEIAANAALLAKLSASVGVSDSASNILDAWLDQDFHNVVAGASSVTVTGTANATQAKVLEGFGNVAAHTIDIQDSLGAITAPGMAGVINLAHSVTATVSADAGRQVFTDAGMTVSANLVYGSTTGLGDTIVATDATHWDTSSADILTLKAGDVLNLAAFNLSGKSAVTGVLDDHTYTVIVGNVSSGGNIFTASATGNATLLLWDADTSAGIHTAGVILVGQSASTMLFGSSDATHLGVTGAPPTV